MKHMRILVYARSMSKCNNGGLDVDTCDRA